MITITIRKMVVVGNDNISHYDNANVVSNISYDDNNRERQM